MRKSIFNDSVPKGRKKTKQWFWRLMLCVTLFAGPIGFAQTYCIPAYTTGCVEGDMIDDFIIYGSGITHFGSGCSFGGYGDFTDDPALQGSLFQGETYVFYLTENYGCCQWLRIYIDFNEDGDFEDAGELLFSSTEESNGTISGSFTVPMSTSLSTGTRLRAVLTYDTLSVDSCTVANYGETHDYTVEILPPLPCPTPSGLGAEVLSLTQAELFWSGNGEGTFDIEWGVQGFALGTGTSVTGFSNTSTILSGLAPNTYYQFYVRQNCGDGDLSLWAGPYTFYTNYCEVVTQWVGFWESIQSFSTTGGIN